MKSAVVIFIGLPGAGKTTLALQYARVSGGSVVSRDRIRDAMFQPCDYTLDEKDASFQALCQSLIVNCRLGRLSIVDGMPFSREGEIERIALIAANGNADFHAFYCDCPVDVAQSRVARDQILAEHVAADRDPALVVSVAKRFRMVPEFATRLDMQSDVVDNLRIVTSLTRRGFI